MYYKHLWPLSLAWLWTCWIFSTLTPPVLSQDIIHADPLALLAGTLRTFQRHACDGTALTLHCPNNTTIDVLYARYGRPRQDTTENGSSNNYGSLATDPCPPLAVHISPDPKVACEYSENVNYKTLQKVVEKCHHKNQCKIQVAPETFSDEDPCPNTRKYIEVAYKCRPETFINKVVCENGEIMLKCDKNSRLAIYSVLFGRSKSGSFMCPQPEGVPEEDCQASFATERVMTRCHGHRQCHLYADANQLGKPSCSTNSRKYMKTVYTCVPRKILKDDYQGDLEDDEYPDEEKNMMSPPAQPPEPHPDPPEPSSSSNPYLTQTPTAFFNPTIRAKIPGKPGSNVLPSGNDYPRDGIPRARPDLINCTVTILSGSQDRAIGFLTEWMKAIAFIKRNFEKFVLYLMVGLCVGLLLFLFVVVGRLLLDRHRAKREAKIMHDPLTSVFATDIDDIDGDLDMSGALGSSLGRSPSPQQPTQEIVCYNTTRPIRRQDSDTNPRSLSRTNNNQLFYS
ncbi:protein eva-1 homolog C-like [Macrobrachium nipponense]|uniref:protein eva-1 homolog C-like n=1 Tax=Macrobrachium nipponense TaxID=159736 RepID=UPI0030C7CCA5